MSAVSVIDLRSLSYTGTTWINLLVGSHPHVFTLGLPQRAYAALDGDLDPSEVCRVHRAACSFWPGAVASWRGDHQKRLHGLYIHLAGCSAATHVAVNNPFIDPRGIADLHTGAVTSFQVSVVRDVRSVVCSHRSRHNTSVAESAKWVAAHADLAADTAELRLRHEDVVHDTAAALQAVGAHVGLEYGDDAVDFWEFEHHLAGGNPGPLRQLRTGRDRAAASQDWASQLTAADLTEIRRVAGHVHEAWGYTW